MAWSFLKVTNDGAKAAQPESLAVHAEIHKRRSRLIVTLVMSYELTNSTQNPGEDTKVDIFKFTKDRKDKQQYKRGVDSFL